MGWLAVSIALMVVVLIFARNQLPRSWRWLGLAIVTVGLIGIVYQWIRPYELPVLAAPGRDMHWLTRPTSVWGSLERQAALVARRQPCTYTLLGWSEDATLYYEGTCGREGVLWSYNPVTDRSPQSVSARPQHYEGRAIQRPTFVNWFRAPSAVGDPESAGYLAIAVQERCLVSPDGRWIAAVVRHIDGPEEVVVLTADEHAISPSNVVLRRRPNAPEIAGVDPGRARASQLAMWES